MILASSRQLAGQNLESDRIKSQSSDYFLFVHGWRMLEYERVAFGDSAYKRMYWSNYKGQIGLFDWPADWVARPAADSGNFDRSEFVAWNSAQGLLNTIGQIRLNMPTSGKLSVMAHSQGNIVLSEALYQAEGLSGGPLVDTAIMSQAAVSSHYFVSDTSSLPSIYKADILDPNWTAHMDRIRMDQHVEQTTWTNYYGFPDAEDVIGGTTPRFRDIDQSATRILNYYNPDDYALATWKLDQLYKPTHEIKLVDAYDAWVMSKWVDTGNVVMPVDLENFWIWLRGRHAPGFAGTKYELTNGSFVRWYTGSVQHAPVTLDYPGNNYEMFAFGASSIVAPVGTTDWTKFGGLFSDGKDLRELSTAFNNLNTGHSAEFVGSYLGVKAYWDKVNGDVQ